VVVESKLFLSERSVYSELTLGLESHWEITVSSRQVHISLPLPRFVFRMGRLLKLELSAELQTFYLEGTHSMVA
jgi:hypothetical protein